MAKTPLKDPDAEMEDIDEMRLLEQGRPAGKAAASRAALVGIVIVVAVLAVIWFMSR